MRISEIELRLQIKLPKEFWFFDYMNLASNHIIIGEDSEFNVDCHLWHSNEYSLWKETLVIDRFLSKDEYLLYWSGRMNGDIWDEGKYLGLAMVDSPYSSWIVVCLEEQNFGAIYIELPEAIQYGNVKERRFKLADDLFSFLSSLTRNFFDDRIEEYKPLGKRLYKNWGEDFWRVREEETT